MMLSVRCRSAGSTRSSFQLANLNSHDQQDVVNLTTALAKLAKAFNVPTVLTSVIAHDRGRRECDDGNDARRRMAARLSAYVGRGHLVCATQRTGDKGGKI